MGTVKNEDYISKPIDYSKFADYSDNIDSNELIPTQPNFYTQNVYPPESVFIGGSKFLIVPSSDTAYTVPSGKKFQLAFIQLIGADLVAGCNVSFDLIHSGVGVPLIRFKNSFATVQDRNFSVSCSLVLFPNDYLSVSIDAGGSCLASFYGYEYDS